ncbi:hypothetical protein [uncultured Chryseobacterium sp.]|uniref:hypothetical protein n=1 Tax=uncultured Chryseobacterium sp. TaxID=259322 RepID=UPI0025D8B430|nr:hypothetical protein [uncultured Chryseobacterium sp.]
MDNLTYEVFIRRCWNCERFKHGANTDTWERLIIDHYNFTNPKPGLNPVKLERIYFRNLSKVKEYLDKAFNKLNSIVVKKKLPQSVIDEISLQRASVAQSEDPQEIFDCITAMTPILDEHDIRLK